MAKTRTTPFARLLLFLILFVPLAYVGASYFNGEDPIANVKGMLGMDTPAPTEQPAASGASTANDTNPPATFENVQDLRDELKTLKRDLAVAREELARCKAADVN